MASNSDVIKLLIDGNKRFYSGNMEHPHMSKDDRVLGMAGQEPKVVVLCCSDSRVPPEIVFDVGLGDMFVVRVAGNVVSELVIGSIEYGVTHLGIEVVLVMGHSQCGAIQAVCDGMDKDGYAPAIADQINKAFRKAKAMSGDIEKNTCLINVESMVSEIKNKGLGFDKLMSDNELVVCGAYYQIDSGEVKFL